jgi:hypothetical protein
MTIIAAMMPPAINPKVSTILRMCTPERLGTAQSAGGAVRARHPKE